MLGVLADPILPVFAILFIGFLAGRTGKVSADHARVLNRFAMTILLPVLMFRLLASAPLSEFELVQLGLYALTEAVVYLLGYLIARHVFARDPAEALLLGFAGVFANNAIYVLPIALLTHGPVAALPVTAVVTLDAAIVFGGTMMALEIMSGKGAHPGVVLARIAKLPILQASVLGLGFALSGYGVPAPLATFASFVGDAASPVALFAMGVVLAQTAFRAEPVVIWVSFVKLLAFPAALFGALWLSSATAGSGAYFLLASAGPSGAMGFSMALLYNVRTDAIAQIIVWTSVLTLFSLAYLI